ncbi:MAG: alanine--tRNA ligase [Gammaproteobacteria bacterium]
MITSAELRTKFLDYFRENDHEIIASSSLVPVNDPTLLFTNAGMVQFKDVFLGQEKRSYVRASSSQRCVRAGGKHNDLENVGYTARHHTFFEMLGNFSFGDYFKRDAIHFAWEFLTKVLEIPQEKLWVTVFEEDDEAADIWLKDIGVDPDRFRRIGAEDNFWSMGDTGPCGPCSEIFYDHGPDVPGGPPGSADADGDRYVEIWNLVFMQFNRDANGDMTPLPKPSVDTGMGLERLAAVMQGVHSNYDIDLFQNLIKAAAKLTATNDFKNNSLHVIADHIRSCVFLIVDEVLPSNEGRGYVLRRIIRRAIRHGYELGIKEPFFYKLVEALDQEMGDAYPELRNAKSQVERILKMEEERFAETLELGMRILDDSLASLGDQKVLPGEVAFKLYDTYGFPVDLTADYALKKNVQLDMEGYQREMNAQRERAREAGQFAVDYNEKLELEGSTEFTGYEDLNSQTSIVSLFRDHQKVESVNAGDEAMVVLKATPFYAESGGQVGDRGTLTSGENLFEVTDTQKQGDVFIHLGKVTKGKLAVGDAVAAEVIQSERRATARNHSATHLLHAALRAVLGDHVTQKGSLVDPARLRFDFSHFEPVTSDQIRELEIIVNDQIRQNNAVLTNIMSFDKAQESGAMALFGEKYGNEVRVLSIGDFSTELCGGTHVNRAGDIGLFKIVSETGIASGVRRIEAVTGENAMTFVAEGEASLHSIAGIVKAGRDDVADKVKQLVDKNRQLEKEVEQLKGKLASNAGRDLATQAIDINGTRVLAAKLDGGDPKSLRDTVDQLKNKLGTAVIVLATVSGDKVSLVAGVTKDTTGKIKAGEAVNLVAEQVGGKGGGRPDMAQAGGNNPVALDDALASVSEWARQKLA